MRKPFLAAAALAAIAMAGCGSAGFGQPAGNTAPAAPASTTAVPGTAPVATPPAPPPATTRPPAVVHTAAPPPPPPPTHAAPPPPPPAHAPPPPPAKPACYPLSNEGTCYEPGEFCRDSDIGTTGVAGDGEAIVCVQDGSRGRWEPA